MKAILEFDLSDPEDQRQYRLCNSAEDANSFIYDIGEQLRSWYKYPGPGLGAAGAAGAALPVQQPGRVRGPAGGAAVRRDEAEAVALVRPHPPAGHPAPGRAHIRGRPHQPT